MSDFYKGRKLNRFASVGLQSPAASDKVLRNGILKPLMAENYPPSKPQTGLIPDCGDRRLENPLGKVVTST